jgi:hypothetical protein
MRSVRAVLEVHPTTSKSDEQINQLLFINTTRLTDKQNNYEKMMVNISTTSDARDEDNSVTAAADDDGWTFVVPMTNPLEFTNRTA